MILKIDKELELRPIQFSDANEIFITIDYQRNYLEKWLPFVPLTEKPEDVETFINFVLDDSNGKEEYTFTIRYKGNFAGVISLKPFDNLNKKSELGYWISENFQGKGIVTRSVKRLCGFAFNEKQLNRIQIKCAVDNDRSINVAKRLDFQYEGIERDGELLSNGNFTDLMIFSLLRRDFDLRL